MTNTAADRLRNIRSSLYNNGYLFAAFFIPALLMFGCYAVFQIQPFGERSVLALDLNAQYVYYYDYMYDVIHNGESLFYSWSRNLSGEFFGIIGYYLASPFNIIVWLFPREMITDGLMCMILAKLASCGCITALYLHKGRGTEKGTAIMFSLMYALCAYSVVQTVNPMWLDGVMVLPLVCWGVESAVKHNRFRLLTGSLIYAFVSNFYIGFMIAIFTVLYYIAEFFACADYKAGVKKNAARFFAKGALVGASGITAALCSSFMLVPVYHSLQNGKFDFTVPDYSLTGNFVIQDMLRKLFVNSYDTVRMEGMPFIFCGSLTLVLIGVYFFCRKIPAARRLSTAGLLAVLTLCMYIKPVDMLWHGGQVPNWLPYRYSFMLSLVMITAAAVMFEKLGRVRTRAVAISALVFIGTIILIEGGDTFIETLGESGREVFDSVTVALPAIIFVTAAAVAAAWVCKQKKRGEIGTAAVIILTAVIGGEMSFNTSNTLNKMHEDIVFSTKESYVDVIVPLREKVAEIKRQDDGFYRIEKKFYRTVNDPIATGMYGLSHSSSTLNAAAIDMLGCFGFTSNGHYTRFSGYTPLTADIFGVKYILDAPYGRDEIKGDPSKITVEENPDALPIMYLSSSEVKGLELDKYTPFANQTALLSALTGTDCSGIYTDIPAGEPIAIGCTQGNFADGHIGFTDAGEDASVSYNITTPKDGEVYMYIPTDYEREVYVYVNGEYKDVLFESDNHNIKLLGSFSAGESINVKLALNRSDLYYKQPQFAVFDENAEKEAIAALGAMNAETVVERVSSTAIDVEVNADADRTLFTTVPYEKGWEVRIDGEKAECVPVLNGSLMAFDISAGRHRIELRFTPAGYPAALIATLAGIALFIAMIVIYRKISAPVVLSKSSDREKPVLAEDMPFDDDGGTEVMPFDEDGETENMPFSGEKEEKNYDTDG